MELLSAARVTSITANRLPNFGGFLASIANYLFNLAGQMGSLTVWDSSTEYLGDFQPRVVSTTWRFYHQGIPLWHSARTLKFTFGKKSVGKTPKGLFL